jgi:hypothetical protein
MYSRSFYTNRDDGTFPSFARGVARLLLFIPDEIYFRARVVIAMDSSLTRIKNIYPLL